MRLGKASLILGIILFLAAGCGQATHPPGNAAGKSRMMGLSIQTMNNPFFVDLSQGIQEVVERHGDRLVTLDAQFDSSKQKNDVSDLLLQGVTGVFLNPVNWEGIKGNLIQAKRQNIPCIVVDAPVKDRDLVLCTVASDNVEAGRMAARAIAEVRPNAKIVILHMSVNKACIDRVAGFQEELKKYPEMQVLDIQEGKGTAEGSRPVMRDLLGRFPDLDAVFPINDPSALGAISALESAGKLKDVTVVSVDGSPDAIAAIKAGKLRSTSAQFPKEIGHAAAEKMYEHLEGKAVDKDIKVRVELITQTNADASQNKD